MVALVDATTSTDSFCGGTLVASKYVVSAAHCMGTNKPSSPTFKVRETIRLKHETILNNSQ